LLGGLLALPLLPQRALAQPLPPPFSAAVQSGARQTLYNPVAIVGNGADTTEDTLQSYTIPANMLANVGDTIHVLARGVPLSSTDVKNVRLRLGGTLLVTMTLPPSSTVANLCEVWIVKTGPSAQSAFYILYSNVNNVSVPKATATVTDTAPIVLTLTGQNSTNSVAGSITSDFFNVEYCRSP
jgi:hypothetical protein